MATWDVIVIGLGGVGSSAVYHLASQGFHVLGIDQFPAVHAMGSSHGKTRIIRQAYFEHPSYVPLLRRAYDLWRDLEHEVHQQLFHRTGLVELGPSDGVVIPGVMRSASLHGLDVQELSVDDVTRRWPGLVGHRDWRAVMENDAGYLRVEACVDAHLQCAKRQSATLRHLQTVRSWCVNGQSIEVRTDAGAEHSAALIVAGGAWSSQLLGDIGMPLRVLRKHQYWFAPRSRGYHQNDGLPCFFYETPQGYFYGFPSLDADGLKVARHSGGVLIGNPSATHPPVDPDDQALVENFLSEFLPGVGGDLQSQAGCYYTLTPDEHFIVDTHPEHPQVAVVAGLSGHGFKFTSVLGEIASQIATGRATSLDTSLLRIQR